MDQVQLHVAPPGAEPFVVPFAAERLVFGRAYDCEVGIADGRASQRHAEIVRTELGFVVRDLGSTNGTYVDDRKVKEAIVQPTSEIRIGQTVIQLRLPAGEREDTSVESGSVAVQTLLKDLERTASKPSPLAPRRLQAIVRFGNRLNAASGEDAILRTVTEEVLETIATDRVYTLTLRNGHLIPRVTRRSGGAGARLPLGVSSAMLYAAVADRHLVFTRDAHADPRFGARPSVHAYSIRSAVTVPLIVGDEVLGVIHTDRSRPTPFDESDLQVLALICNHAAASLAKARLIKKLQRQNRELERTQQELLGLNRKLLERARSDAAARGETLPVELDPPLGLPPLPDAPEPAGETCIDPEREPGA